MDYDKDKTSSPKSKHRERLTLYKEYRLVERNETEISGSWKGTHLLFFFLAFVFGSFCTFCFHVLMYLFDEKCVLFPKLLLLKELRHSVLYDYMPNAGLIETLPVDFVTTHWMDKSTCYLPTYVPLISGIFGLVWTTMFLMFSSGSRTLGLQRSWRLLPPVIVFSVAMSSLCIYTSAVTTTGLMDLCAKLSEITGSTTCSYTINVVTLAFERRIRGVFQAIQLTIISAWLHTCCWVLTAVVALVRVLLVIDFRLVCISADLCGNIEKMLERHERHIRTVSPEQVTKDNFTNTRMHARHSSDSIKVRFTNKEFAHGSEQTLHYFYLQSPEEKRKVLASELCGKYSKEHLFIIKILYDALYSALPASDDEDDFEPLDLTKEESSESSTRIVRQHGRSSSRKDATPFQPAKSNEGDHRSVIESKDSYQKMEWKDVFSQKPSADMTSSLNMTPDLKQSLQMQQNRADRIKSNLKDSAKQETGNAPKQSEKIITPHAKSQETVHSTETLKPFPRDGSISETDEQHKESRGDGAQDVPNPVTQTYEEVLRFFKNLSMPTATGLYFRPKEARTSSQDRQVPTPAAQTEWTSNVLTSFESLSVTPKSLTRTERPGASKSEEMQTAAPKKGDESTPVSQTTDSQSHTSFPELERVPRPTRISRPYDQHVGDLINDDNGYSFLIKRPRASTSQEMQMADLTISDENSSIPQTATNSQSRKYFSEPERVSRPYRVSRSQDQQFGDLINDDDENCHLSTDTKDEGMQTLKKEKQD